MKPPFAWDAYSDQPAQLKDRAYKKRMRGAHRGSLGMTVLTSLLALPAALLALPFLRPKPIEASRFAGMVIDPLREPETTLEAIGDMGIESVLIRIKMWEPESLPEVAAFLKHLEKKDIFFVLMQDRECIENETLRTERFRLMFETLSAFGNRFQIGTTPNRAKWSFFGMDEYFAFFKTAQNLKRSAYPDLELIGPGVIDFEYHYTAHALFNFAGVRFDAVSALLYVDRRGAPENTQLGCDLPCKINLFSSMTGLSPRARSPLYITETNWPLTGTAPYAPTSEFECVDEEAHASFIVRYYLLSLATLQVRTVYWHQLVAPGYGLIDNRDGIRKRPAYFAFKTMQAMLKDAQFVALRQQRTRFEMLLQKPEGILRIYWSNAAQQTQQFSEPADFVSRDGNRFRTDRLEFGDAPVYLFQKAVT